ncbi:pseudouridylate synthase 7 homolog-like protein isoform X3 [Rhinatrema bivittatum]|uniref:pseudouridylate synthase 7 homolog-like protein isoform X3 n=1 Tax=Rhinatrema bivittatum TaxID=194408 RepID=UPI00112CF4B9|nr:pseudouridylate synthase 7 homolog-like protein isoform X3 [Rhinatrema bivittatum]
MEGDVNHPSCFHSLGYLNDHIGFCGSIKNSPSDFVVTEIDMFGQSVRENVTDSLLDFDELPDEQNSLCQHKKLKTVPEESSLEEEHFQRWKGFVNRTNPSRQYMILDTDIVAGTNDECGPEETDILSSLLAVPILESLTEFACSVKSELCSKMEAATPQIEFSLGSFIDKGQRAIIHSAIQQTFPFLITATRNTEVIVKPNLDYRELCQLVSEEEAGNFFKYLDAKLANSKFTFKPDMNKEHRKAVHHFLSKKFGKLVETKTFSKEDSGQQNTIITARFRAKIGSRKRRCRADCLDTIDTYTAFTLRKENLETLEAICCLSSELGVLPSDFSYAGIKDKKAITYQTMVVKKKNGFINYYGPQRFGQGKHVQSNQIGLALLKEDMVKAVKLLFTPEEEDNPVNRAKRHFLQTEDAKGTLALFPECKVRERMVLRALNRYGVNPEGCTRAWFSIPHSMRIFYVHAYCSKVWNEAASYRLKTYGSRVVEGDLVSWEAGTDETPLSDRVHVVTASEETSKTYALHQVILPMLGHNIRYPDNKVGEWYFEMLGKDELQKCTFRNSLLQLNIPGCYRHIVKYPRHLSYVIEDSENVLDSKDGTKELNSTLSSKPSLSISFELDSSCYATVCLREIMKYGC